jgi:5-amino-6-(5-phospho-D-ribitylamino)uracil phosphatase
LNRFRLVALDVDGTLLDPDSRMAPSTKAAVARVTASGITPVLCTGRRYRRALPIALELGLDSPLVCNSGALVKDPVNGRTLWRAEMPQAVSDAVLELFDENGRPAVAMLDEDPEGFDFRIPRLDAGCPLFQDYVQRNREHARVDSNCVSSLRTLPQFHLFAIGERPAMLELEKQVLSRVSNAVRTFVQRSPAYAGTMCEVLDASAGKWSALLHLAELWGIDPSEIVAVGDDMNDGPMLEGAGLGVAMGHAPSRIRAVADRVLNGDNQGSELADFLDELALNHV